MKLLNQTALEVIRDQAGAVTLGWVGERVYYARFVGDLSASVGHAHLARLGEAVAGVSSFAYFSDASALSSYDVLVRSKFLRFMLEHRAKFSSIVMLARSGGVTPAVDGVAAAVSGSITLVPDVTQFEKLLGHAAPVAKQRLLAKASLQSIRP